MKNILTQFSRLFVGILFIISGLIKLNDPLGFSYKLAEYFSEPVFNMPFFTPYALSIALFIVILEVVLGVFLLLGYQTKWTIRILLVMIIKFSFLTFYSAYYDVVKDCGCFGDALHLTPWESFTKDIVLLIFILILAFNSKLIKPLFGPKTQSVLAFGSFLAAAFMGYWVLNHLPLIDFRPYKVGTNIQKGMEIPEGAPKSVVEMIFIYNVNGQNKEFTENDLMNLPEGATFVDRKDKIISEGYVPPIHDFTMEKEGTDYKDELLQEAKLLVFIAYDLPNASVDGLKKLTSITKVAKQKGYKVIGMTASTPEQITTTQQKYAFDFDFYFCDATTLKTIERANPSLMILNQGTIVQKVHYNDSADLRL
ncbi:BT_3928 family protein [Flavobacterium sp. UMI-01]|uniref:BT_3928 family protein n=1 Tax=Flavobacterium sp. UMI-01 TaxID=1441053 RepID=UPI001C7CBB07|nr:BT_3928 family protein [Flavobacterium sp. UMI-01]GIZ08271.1 hypothetical protein FUMI01_09980 [Flavobacterium sp. UMI-01]